jgi:hypothetical protein
MIPDGKDGMAGWPAAISAARPAPALTVGGGLPSSPAAICVAIIGAVSPNLEE